MEFTIPPSVKERRKVLTLLVSNSILLLGHFKPLYVISRKYGRFPVFLVRFGLDDVLGPLEPLV